MDLPVPSLVPQRVPGMVSPVLSLRRPTRVTGKSGCHQGAICVRGGGGGGGRVAGVVCEMFMMVVEVEEEEVVVVVVVQCWW